jgi:hypothetical protein
MVVGELMKLNTKDIAERIHSNTYHNSSTKHIEDVITEMILTSINPQIEKWTEQVLEHLQELEHPKPRNKADYDERYGYGDGY